MASQYTFNGVSLDDPGGRWAVDREWYLPQGGPGVAALPVEAAGCLDGLGLLLQWLGCVGWSRGGSAVGSVSWSGWDVPVQY